jgi:hypothetical protein
MQRNLDAMLQRFTDKHPDVVSARRLIKELEEQKREEIVARRKTAATNPASSVYDQSGAPATEGFPLRDRGESRGAADPGCGVSGALRSAERRSVWCPRSRPSLRSSIATTRSTRRTTNNWCSGVNRPAWGARSQHRRGRFPSDRPAAGFTQAGSPQSQPVPAADPASGPGRRRGCAFAASQLRPVFFDSRSLREACGLPLLGTVSMLTDEATKRRERRICCALLPPVSRWSAPMVRGFSPCFLFPSVLPEEN